MSEMRLRYGEVLLALLRREVLQGRYLGRPDMSRVNALCDRFERLLAALRVAPLVWEGDYA